MTTTDVKAVETTGTTYEVVVTREGENWLGEVTNLDGTATWGRSLESLLASVREAIIVMDDLPDDAQVPMHCTYDIDDDIIRTAAELARQRRDLDELSAAVVAKTSRLAVDLVAHHLSYRDAAQLLGVTPGRVSQLVKAAKL